MTAREMMIARLHAVVSMKPLMVLAHDDQLQIAASVWEYLDFSWGKDAKIPSGAGGLELMTVPQLAGAAWDGVLIDFDGARRVLGPAFPVAHVIRRLGILGLGFPDNTLHKTAENWISVRAANVTRDMLKRATGNS